MPPEERRKLEEELMSLRKDLGLLPKPKEAGKDISESSGSSFFRVRLPEELVQRQAQLEVDMHELKMLGDVIDSWVKDKTTRDGVPIEEKFKRDRRLEKVRRVFEIKKILNPPSD